jgi:cytochrome c
MRRSASFLTVVLLTAPVLAHAAGDPVRGAEIYRVCVACHALAPGLHLTGPSLGGVWMRAAGAAEGFARYSPALRGAGFSWDSAALDAWLADPQAMLPGTTMAFPGIADPAFRADLIAFLERAGAPRGAEQLVREGVIPEIYLSAQAPEPLRDAPPEARVTAVRHCGDGYAIETADGRESLYWEQNIRLKIDSAETGPPTGVGVIVGAGMQGDRFSVIFASLADLVALVSEDCSGATEPKE